MAKDYGIKISPRNQNVQSVTDKDVQFSSKLSTLKILAQGEVTLTTNGAGNGSTAVSHGLGFAPAFYIFRKGTAQFTFLDAASFANAYFPDPEINNLWNNGIFTCYSTASSLIISCSGQAPSTVYTFKYYILIDLAEEYAAHTNLDLNSGFGMKVSKDSFDVKTTEEYNLVYSQKYKSIQYYDESYKTGDMTLPELNSTLFSNPTEQGTYVDIMHGLGYPPLFLIFIETGGLNFMTPYNHFKGNNISFPVFYNEQINAFCDADRIRLAFYRQSQASSSFPTGFSSEIQKTITFKCFIFTEDLSA